MEDKPLATCGIFRIQHVLGIFRFYYMVGEPYHGGDFMTLTQRAKEQQVPMTEDRWGWPKYPASIAILSDMFARFLSFLRYVHVCPHFSGHMLVLLTGTIQIGTSNHGQWSQRFFTAPENVWSLRPPNPLHILHLRDITALGAKCFPLHWLESTFEQRTPKDVNVWRNNILLWITQMFLFSQIKRQTKDEHHMQATNSFPENKVKIRMK